MLTWKIGDVTIKRVVEMELPVPFSEKHSFLKQATPGESYSAPYVMVTYVFLAEK